MDKKWCINCGAVLSPEAEFCASCGAKQPGNADAPYSEPTPTYSAPTPTYSAPTPTYSAPTHGFDINGETHKPSGLAIASMILGIVTLVFFWLFYIALPTGIPGLVLGIISLKKNISSSKGMAKAGVIMSAIGLGLAILFVVFIICIAISASSSSYYYY